MGLILLRLHINHVSVSRPHGPLVYFIELFGSPFDECAVRCLYNGIEEFSRNHMKSSSTVEEIHIVTDDINLIHHVFQTQQGGQGKYIMCNDLSYIYSPVP